MNGKGKKSSRKRHTQDAAGTHTLTEGECSTYIYILKSLCLLIHTKERIERHIDEIENTTKDKPKFF